MNFTAYPNSTRFFVQHDSCAVSDLHKQYKDLVKLLDNQTTVVVEPDDFIAESLKGLYDPNIKIPTFDKIYIAQVGDSLVFVFIKLNPSKNKWLYLNSRTKITTADMSLRSVYAIIFSGLSKVGNSNEN